MEENNNQTQEDVISRSFEKLAKIDLIYGIASAFFLIAIFIYSALANRYWDWGLPPIISIPIMFGSVYILNIIFSIKSYRRLKRRDPAGIKLSLISKVIFFLFIFFIPGPFGINIYLPIGIINLLIIRFIVLFKNQLILLNYNQVEDNVSLTKYSLLKDGYVWTALIISLLLTAYPLIYSLKNHSVDANLSFLYGLFFLAGWVGWIILEKGKKGSLIIGFIIGLLLIKLSLITVMKLEEKRLQYLIKNSSEFRERFIR